MALGISACRRGHRVMFAQPPPTGSPRLSHDDRAGKLAADLVERRHHGLIIIDEVGYLPLEKDAANLCSSNSSPAGMNTPPWC